MKFKVLLIVALALCLSAPVALAAPGFQDFTTADINQNGTPYWDNPSLDPSGARNVGYFLTGTGDFFPGTNYLGTGPQYLGNDDGSAVLNFFTAAHASFNNTFLLRITAYDGTDTVGIYDHTNPANKTVLFGPGDAVGATKVITISTFFSFGFYGISGDGNTYYSVSDLNPSGETDHQHFALFRDKNNPICWYLGFEDLAGISGTEGYGDYNDMVVQLFCPVPLPGALVLLGSGLVGLASYGRRRRKLAA